MEEQNQQKRKTPESVVAGEACAEALCGKGISAACAAPEKFVSSPEVNVVDEDDDEDLQLALALSASLAESKSGRIPTVSDSYETRENSENLRPPLQSSGKGEESQKQEMLLADVAGSPRNSSSSSSVDSSGSIERRGGSSTSASSRNITGVRRSSTRSNKNTRKASYPGEFVCNRLKERRLSSKYHNTGTDSPSGAESGSSRLKPLTKDSSSRGGVQDSFGSSSSRIRGSGDLHAAGGSLASSNSSAADEGTVPISGFVPYSGKETSRKGVIIKENADLLGEEKQKEHTPFYRPPCSASALRTPNWLLSSSIVGQPEILESNADDDDALCRNAFGERRRERRERRRGISSMDDDADALKEEKDMEQVFCEERIKKSVFGTQDITGRRKSSEEQHINPGSQYSIQYALPTTTCGSTVLVPNVDAAIAKQECIGSHSIGNSSSSSSSFFPGSSIRGSRMSHSGSSSSSSSTTENSSSGASRRRSNAREGNLSSHSVAGQGSSFPSSAGGMYREEHCREGAEHEGEKRQSYAGGGFRLQQQQQPQYELQGLATRETDPIFERKPVEKNSSECESSRGKSASVLLQQQHSGQQQDVSLEFKEQQQGAPQKSLLMSPFTLSDDSMIDAGKSVILNERGGSETGAAERRRTQRRKLRGKTADGTSGKRKRKRRRTNTDEDTEEDDDTLFKCENGSTVSDGTETATVVLDDEDDEETQLQVALAVSLSTADQENHPSCYAGTMVSTTSPSGSNSSSSLRISVQGGNSDNSRSRGSGSIGSNRSCSSSSGNISGAGSAHSSSGRRVKRDGSGPEVDEGGYSCSPSTEDAQEVPQPKFRRVSRDGEQDDSCVRMDARSSDCEGSRKCEHCCSSREKACGEKSRAVEGSAKDLSEDTEGSGCPSEEEITRSRLNEAAVSSVDRLSANAGVTPTAAVSTVDEEHAVSSYAARIEANMGSICNTKGGPVPAVSADSALKGFSLLEDLPIREAQTAGKMIAAGPSAAAITEVTAAAQTRGAIAYETSPGRAGMATAETTTSGTTTAGTTRPHLKVSRGHITRSIGRGAARAEADAASMQWEEIGFSGDSEENALNGENSSDSDFEPETKDDRKKKRKKRQSVQQQQGREAQHGPVQRSAVDSGHSSDSSNSSNESTSVEEEEEHDSTDDSDKGGRVKQTHGKVTRDRHMQTQRKQQQQTRTYRREHQQRRRKSQRICKTSEDGKSERRWRSAVRSDVRSTLSVEVEEKKRIADEVKKVSVECQNDVDDAETAAVDENESDSAATDSAENDSDVGRTHVTMLHFTSGLADASSPSPPTGKCSTVSAGVIRRPATAAASRRGKGAVAEAEVVEPSASADSEADNKQAGDEVHDKNVKGRQRGSCTSGRRLLSKTKQEKEGKKPRTLAQQQRQNEKQELRYVSNAAATAAVKIWKHEKLHEACLYIWAALTEAISIPSKSEAAPRGNAQRSAGAERLIRAIDEQHRRQQQREQEHLEHLLQEQQQPRVGKRVERETPGDRKVCIRMPSDSLAHRHPQLQQGVLSFAISSQLSVPDSLRQRQQQQELPRREQQDKQLSTRKQQNGQQQLQQLPRPRPFLTLEQLGKVAEAAGLASLTVDELMKMVATAAGAAGAASTTGKQQQQERQRHTGHLPEKKRRNRKQHGCLGTDSCSRHYSQALGRTTLSFEEFVSFFHYGLGLKVESNGKVW